MLPTSTDVSIAVKTKAAEQADAVVVFVTQDASSIESDLVPRPARRAAERLLNAGVIRGKAKELAFDLVESTSAKGKHARVFIVGLGSAEKVTPELIRQAAGKVLRALRKHRMADVAVIVPEMEAVSAAAGADAIITGIVLAAFRYDEYHGTAHKKDDDEK